MSSVSKIPIVISIEGKDHVQANIFRHLAPITINSIIRGIPLEGRVIRNGDVFIYFQTRLRVGQEKPKSHFKKGDIAFLPITSSIFFFLKDAKMKSPMNLVGKVTINTSLLEGAKSGCILKVYLDESPSYVNDSAN